MGCVSSKVENEETVARCKARKRFMKQAVTARHAFAVAHIQYLQALQSTGVAVRRFAQGDEEGQDASQVPATPASVDVLSLAPSSPPSFPSPPSSPPMSPPPSVGLSRKESSILPSVSPAKKSKGASKASLLASPKPASQESWQSAPHVGRPPPPPTTARSSWQAFLDPFRPPAPPFHLQEQRKLKQMRESDGDVRDKADGESVPPTLSEESGAVAKEQTQQPVEKVVERAKVTAVESPANRDLAMVASSNGRDLVGVLKDVDELFSRVAGCGDQMSRMLETRKVHYLSNFAQNKGYFENSSRVFNSSLTFFSKSASSKSLLSVKSGGDESLSHDECGAMGSHAATLDRLFAWEKKLFDEVKGAEIIRVELAKKVVQLRHQEARGEDPLVMEKTRVLIKSLQTRVMVAFQAVDGALAKIQELRDEELYPQLLELLEGMKIMWKDMLECHQKQKALVLEIQTLGDSGSLELTNGYQRQVTAELEAAVTKWHAAFNTAMAAQKEYMSNLNGWLRLSMMQAVSEEQDVKDKSGLPAIAGVAPVFTLCQEWQQALDRLPYACASEGITSFIGVVRTIVAIQVEEQRQQKRKEATEKELDKKILALNNYEKKYVEPWIPPPTSDSDEKSDIVEEATASPPENPYFVERKAQVEALRKRLEEEDINVGKAIQDTRSVTLSSFQTGLPHVFDALSTFAIVCTETYDTLHSQGLSKTSKFELITDK